MQSLCPLTDSRNSRSWIILQKSGSHYSRAWAYSSQEKKVYEESGSGIAGLGAKSQKESGEIREIPESLLCIPTGFDLQVHLRFPGQESRETLEGGLASAFLGGYDTVVTMPNTEPFLDQPEVLRDAIREVALRMQKLPFPMRAFFTAAGTHGMRGEAATDIAALVRAGAVAITDDGWGVHSADAMEEIFRQSAAASVPFLQHAEMRGHKGHASASDFQRRTGIHEYPRSAESDMVERDLQILRRVPGARYHVLHISTRETLAAVRRGKEAGLAVTCEVSPHHLLFSNADIPAETDPRSTAFKMNPPLFAPEDRDELRAALQEGLIDCVSTDHAPHTAESKRGHWQTAPFGTRGLETALPVLITLLQAGELTEKRLRETFSEAGRKILGNSASAKATGFIFADPSQEFTVTERDLPGISRNSCFLGARLRGKVLLRAEGGRIFSRE